MESDFFKRNNEDRIIFLNENYWQTVDISGLTKSLIGFNLSFNEKSLKADAKNTFLKNEYLTLDHILNTVRPILAEKGLAVSQLLAGENIITNLYHESGQFIGSSVQNTPMQESKGTNKLQQIGGGLTYMRRYALCSILNISIDTDDDAQSMPPQKGSKGALPESMYNFAYTAYVRDNKSFDAIEAKGFTLTAAAKKDILKLGPSKGKVAKAKK